MSRISAVRSMTLMPRAWEMLRSWIGESGSSETKSTAASARAVWPISSILPRPKNSPGAGAARSCVMRPTTVPPAAVTRPASSSSDSSIWNRRERAARDPDELAIADRLERRHGRIVALREQALDLRSEPRLDERRGARGETARQHLAFHRETEVGHVVRFDRLAPAGLRECA